MGPLAGLIVVEMAGAGPAPFAGMMLADLGADVVRVDRVPAAVTPVRMPWEWGPEADFLARGRCFDISVDLKAPTGPEIVTRLVEGADVLIEGYRPGVMERLGLGPDAMTSVNPRLIYGRMTGWGQDGPLALAAGHDVNYIALAGVLAHIGHPEGPPVLPLNLIGDFAGGGLVLALGIMCALFERGRSGRGQVIDSSMVEGAALLMTAAWGQHSVGGFRTGGRGVNTDDGSIPFNTVYKCSDGQYISIAALEPKFFAELVDRLQIDLGLGEAPHADRANWPAIAQRFTEIFQQRSQREWCEILEGTDACFAPVLTMTAAATHPHLAARRAFIEVDGKTQPAPQPQFSRTPAKVRHSQPAVGADTRTILSAAGYQDDKIAELLDVNAIWEAAPAGRQGNPK